MTQTHYKPLIFIFLWTINKQKSSLNLPEFRPPHHQGKHKVAASCRVLVSVLVSVSVLTLCRADVCFFLATLGLRRCCLTFIEQANYPMWCLSVCCCCCLPLCSVCMDEKQNKMTVLTNECSGLKCVSQNTMRAHFPGLVSCWLPLCS